MNISTITCLLLSVLLSGGRNIASKKTAVYADKRSQFYLSQTVLFLAATILLSLFYLKELGNVSGITVMFGLIYGVLLVLSQWMFTLALKRGNTSVCSVVYALGFILPTISGALFWEESFTGADFAGLLLALCVILLTAKKEPAGKRERNEKHDSENTRTSGSFIPFILTAMLASGGLGIMQKVQQSSAAAQEKGSFLIIAFLLASVCSFTAFLLCREKGIPGRGIAIYPAAAGICFGGANLCNTILAGRMKSAVFFPVQNISTILLATVLGMVLFHEKMTMKTVLTLILGIGVVLIFSL